ncbi:uncharacterized protein METZ01_LOCUS490971, partial [marine metagenome]
VRFATFGSVTLLFLGPVWAEEKSEVAEPW